MFVNVSPVRWNVSETLCSLKFAHRCRNVALGAASQHVDSGELVRLRRQIEELQATQRGGEGVRRSAAGSAAAAGLSSASVSSTSVRGAR